MEISHLLAFNAMLLAALVSPGPAMLVALHTALTRGRWAGILCGFGLAFAAALWTLAALVGLDGIFRAFPWAYGTLKAAGALYLCHLAWKTWRHADDAPADVAAGRGASFRRGALTNLANPKSMLFAAAVLVVVFPAGLAPAGQAIIVVNHFAVESAAYALLAVTLGGRSAASGYLRAKSWLDRITATVLGALGLRLLLDRGP